MIYTAEDITEVVLVKLSTVPIVGKALEDMSRDDYDRLEAELKELILKVLNKEDVQLLDILRQNGV